MCWYSQAESNCPQSVITEVYPVELGVSWNWLANTCEIVPVSSILTDDEVSIPRKVTRIGSEGFHHVDELLSGKSVRMFIVTGDLPTVHCHVNESQVETVKRLMNPHQSIVKHDTRTGMPPAVNVTAMYVSEINLFASTYEFVSVAHIFKGLT